MERNYRKAIELIISICQVHGTTPVLLTQPNRVNVEDEIFTSKYNGHVLREISGRSIAASDFCHLYKKLSVVLSTYFLDLLKLYFLPLLIL